MEPKRSFFHAALKVKWAGILLNDLNARVNAWIASKPCAVWAQYDPEIDATHIMSGIQGHLDASLPLLAGDIVANLRSSLDCAWMGLVRAAGVKDKHTMPIADNRKGLESTVGKSPVKASLDDAVALLADDLGAHRDFDNGGSRPLVALNDLNNWQKHNLMVTTPLGVTGHSLKVSTTKAKEVQVDGNRSVSIAPLSILTLGGTLTQLEQEGEATSEILISGGDFGQSEPLIPALVQFHEVATKALESFADRFPAGDSPRFRETIAK